MRPLRIACVLVPQIAVQVALQRRPELAGRPVIVGGYPHERRNVAGASPEALASGVSPGIPLRQAAGLCPNATFLPLDTSLTGEVFACLFDVMESFSPTVEAEPPDTFYLDVTGIGLSILGRAGPPGEEALLQSLLQEAQSRSGLALRAGAAATKFSARAAAMLAGEQPCIVPPGEDHAFLAPVSITLLPCSTEMQRRLHLFGLRTLGEFADLPFGPVQAQFGRTGAALWHLARGEDDRPLLPRRLPAALSHDIPFESPTSSNETLVKTVELALDALVPNLKRLFIGFRQVTLLLSLEDQPDWEHTWTLHEPATQPVAALSLIAATLHDLALAGPVERLRLLLHDLTQEEGRQESLFSITARRMLQLREAVRQVEGRCGRNLLRRAIMVDPRSHIPERRRALVEFRGPDA